MRKQKHKFVRRFVAVTYVEAPFGPGLYVHPGLYSKPFGMTGKVRRKRASLDAPGLMSMERDYSGTVDTVLFENFIKEIQEISRQ